MRGWAQEISRAQVLGTCPRYYSRVLEVWEEQSAFVEMVRLVLARPRRVFGQLADGDVGQAWTFAALCCLVPRLVYGLLDGRGGPMVMLMRALLSAAVQAASATFFLGSAHYLFVLSIARTHANWRVSARAAGYAQPITMVVGSLAAGVMLALPAYRESVWLRDLALLASATWFAVPLYWVGERLGLGVGRALYTALGASVGVGLALRALA